MTEIPRGDDFRGFIESAEPQLVEPQLVEPQPVELIAFPIKPKSTKTFVGTLPHFKKRKPDRKRSHKIVLKRFRSNIKGLVIATIFGGALYVTPPQVYTFMSSVSQDVGAALSPYGELLKVETAKYISEVTTSALAIIGLRYVSPVEELPIGMYKKLTEVDGNRVLELGLSPLGEALRGTVQSGETKFELLVEGSRVRLQQYHCDISKKTKNPVCSELWVTQIAQISGDTIYFPKIKQYSEEAKRFIIDSIEKKEVPASGPLLSRAIHI